MGREGYFRNFLFNEPCDVLLPLRPLSRLWLDLLAELFLRL